MAIRNISLKHRMARCMQHLVFWVLLFMLFLQVFRNGDSIAKVDYVYAFLFHATIIPAVYINLLWLLPSFAHAWKWPLYLTLVLLLIAVFTTLNYFFFQDWSQYLLPDFFFISYFSWWQVSAFFFFYLIITSLLKFSRSWFEVNALQKQLLETEKGKVQMELRALQAQVNPHFFFNTLNGIYSMSLHQDQRLPDTVLKLSQLMRYFLYEAGEQWVLLEKEWQALLDYISLQQLRAGQSLQVTTSVNGQINRQELAPLILIAFLENAFKHGGRNNENNFIHIDLDAAGDMLHYRIINSIGISNEVEKKQPGGLGMENVKRRLQLLYPLKHQLQITDNGQEFIADLRIQI
ncbi:MAG: sensor histidine kinase [Pseudobacter sp.]|uniref:sensor histidine kinase n=1 Tax=Pseudobacter sp. TaxID=2045420 RepID=UPI003F7D54EB